MRKVSRTAKPGCLAPHDMARIGYLYLHDGMWDGKQIIPSSWVERAKAGIVPATGGTHYSNLWWSFPEKGAYMALGRHSQMILVMPKLDIVAIMTGIVRDDERRPIRQVIDGTAGSIKADVSLPPDPAAQALLATAIQNAATESLPKSAARRISPRKFQARRTSSRTTD
jgi:CubicO group peptidase (beta-lactamase class C family)